MNKYLSSTDLKNISGGKSKLPIPSWSQLRDTIWGFTDGITGQKRKSRKKRLN